MMGGVRVTPVNDPDASASRMRRFVAVEATGSTPIGIGSAINSVGAPVYSSGQLNREMGSIVTTAATINSQAGFRTANWQSRFSSLPKFSCRFSIGDVTNIRFFAGLNNSNGQVAGQDAPVSAGVALRFSTGSSDTTFKIVSSDGTTANVIDTGLPVNSGDLWDLGIWTPSLGTAQVQMQKVTTGTGGGLATGPLYTMVTTTNVPNTSTKVAIPYIQSENLEALAKAFTFYRMFMSFGAHYA